MMHQSTSLMDTFENDNEAFLKDLTVQFVQKEIDYDYSINYNVLFNLYFFNKQHELPISQSFFNF